MTKKIRLILIFLFSLSYFAMMQNNGHLTDPDSFYHAKMAEIMAHENLVVTKFPWLPFTIFEKSYIDHHFLYHVALVPFCFLNGLIGIKIATALFGAMFLTLFAWILFSVGVILPEFFVILLLTNAPLMLRMNLAKAPSFSLIFLFAGLWAILKKRTNAAGLIAFFYVWAYDGWLLLPAIAFIFALTEYIKDRTISKTFLSICAGTALGIIVNPFFPTNLTFYWEHIVKIGLVGYQNIISVGGEWYPASPKDFLASNSLVLDAVFLTLSYAMMRTSKNRKEELSLFFIALIFSALALRSQRNIEYAVPFMVFFSAYTLRSITKEDIKNFFISIQKDKRSVLVLLAFSIIVMLNVFKHTTATKENLNDGFKLNHLQKESNWLKENTKNMEVVFNDDWGDFPPLFYYDTHNRFIAGLDPAFLYAANMNKFNTWLKITDGSTKDNLRTILRDQFDTETLVVNKENSRLIANITANGFKEVFKGDDAIIYAWPR